jgi:hypothetical protein
VTRLAKFKSLIRQTLPRNCEQNQRLARTSFINQEKDADSLCSCGLFDSSEMFKSFRVFRVLGS